MVIDRAALRRLVRARELLAKDARSVRAIADAVAISPYHFIRQFEAVFGITPHQFRTERRLAEAKRLLSLGRSVTEVCFDVGFASVGSFSTLFTRRIGVPPSAYRRRVQVRDHIPIVSGCLGLLGELPLDAFRNCREATLA